MTQQEIEDQKLRGLMALRGNLEAFCANCLKIKTKSGGANVPFIWNRAQRFIHERLERQRAEVGYVRALILKGRQQGCSTYVAARYYHKTSMNAGSNAFIVAHEDKATSNLFDMVKRYDDHNVIAPSKKASNAKELVFGQLDSGYKLATAGSKDVGRSNTARLLHGSEFGFWDNAQGHLAGIGNTIPSGTEGEGTEIILESTANGLGNAFHLMWQSAERGFDEDGNPFDYIAIFVPWYWQEEYRSPVKKGFTLDDDAIKYMEAYGADIGGLSMEQMQWRADKIASYGKGFAWLFDQEYPATAVLAFKTSTQNPLISPADVAMAQASTYSNLSGPIVVGCDPAGDGTNEHDRTAIAWRQGRVLLRMEYYNSLSTMQIAGKLAEYWNNGMPRPDGSPNPDRRPDGIFVDKTGLGAGIVDRLHELNVPAVGVNNAGKANNTEVYENKRAEMWFGMKEWFEDHPVRIPPSSEVLMADVCAPQPVPNSSNGRKLIEKKENMLKRGIRSPDGGDALSLTFAETVSPRIDNLATTASRPATKAGY